MTPIQLVLLGIGLLFALAIARGMYLIGSGCEAEHQARSTSVGNDVLGSGWMILDSLRSSSHPAILFIESKLGIDTKAGDQLWRHNRCGSTNVEKRGTSWYCYNCDQQTSDVEEVR